MSLGTLQQRLTALRGAIRDTEQRREYHIGQMVHHTQVLTSMKDMERDLKRQLREAEHEQGRDHPRATEPVVGA